MLTIDTETKLDCIYAERLFRASFVRRVCQHYRGNKIADQTWSNWRRWTGIDPNRRLYTFEEFRFLTAISFLRGQQRNDRQQLIKSQILAKANSLEWHSQISQVIKRYDDSDLVFGADVVFRLAEFGLIVSRQELYRKIEGFNFFSIYRVSELLEKVA